MTKVIPTLSAKGYAASVLDKSEAAMTYFCLSQYSQTNIYRGNVVTLAWLVQRYGDDYLEIRNQVESALNNYLGRIFDEAQVSVVAEQNNDRTDLQVNIVVRDGTDTQNLGYLIRTTNNKVLDVFDINNQGYIGNHATAV